MYTINYFVVRLFIHLLQYLDETVDNLDGLPFKLHDFGFRGSTSVEVRTCPFTSVIPRPLPVIYILEKMGVICV